MILKSEASGGAGRGKSKLINNFFPKFVMRDRLSSSLFAYCFVEFIEIKLLPSNLWYFDIGNAFGCPILVEMLLKFVLLF